MIVLYSSTYTPWWRHLRSRASLFRLLREISNTPWQVFIRYCLVILCFGFLWECWYKSVTRANVTALSVCLRDSEHWSSTHQSRLSKTPQQDCHVITCDEGLGGATAVSASVCGCAFIHVTDNTGTQKKGNYCSLNRMGDEWIHHAVLNTERHKSTAKHIW